MDEQSVMYLIDSAIKPMKSRIDDLETTIRKLRDEMNSDVKKLEKDLFRHENYGHG